MMARRNSTGDLRPEATNRVGRARIEALREQGRYRELVLWMLGVPEPWQPENNNEFETRVVRVTSKWRPTPNDLAGALRESDDPLPKPIREYIISHHLLQTKPIKTGPSGPSRSMAEDDKVLEFYVGAYVTALDRHEQNQGPKTRAVATLAKQQTAKHFEISKSTIDTILAQYRILK